MTIDEAKSSIKQKKPDSKTDLDKPESKQIILALDTAVQELDKVEKISKEHEKTVLPKEFEKAVKALEYHDLSSAEKVRSEALKWVDEWNPKNENAHKKSKEHGGSTEPEKDAAEQANGNKKQMGDTDKISNTINCCNWFNNNSISKVSAAPQKQPQGNSNGGESKEETTNQEVDPKTKSRWCDHVGDIITLVVFTISFIYSLIKKSGKVDWDATSGIAMYITAACSLMADMIYKLFVEKKRGAVSKNASSQSVVEVKNKYQPNKAWWIILSVIAGIGLVIMLLLAYFSVLETMFGSWQSTLIYCCLCVAFIVTIGISLIIILFYDKLVEPTANNTEG